MFRVLVVLAALSAVALAIEDRGIFRRFMDLMGSECGAFGCKRDTQVSRAVRDYAYALRDADQKVGALWEITTREFDTWSHYIALKIWSV